MKKFIVITTINAKTEGIVKFEQLSDWHIVLVGDKKSPEIESSERLTFLSIGDQIDLGYEFVSICPYNHYTRKNIGYLYAIQQGADVIYDTDDDNLPYDDWRFPEFHYRGSCLTGLKFANIYAHFTDTFIWPRGFPLDELQQSTEQQEKVQATTDIGVWQGLADWDPDVDAIYRLLFTQQVRFQERAPVVLARGTFCPFNSQNTLWNRQAFPYLYLPAGVSFRFTDILRGYIAQRLMWENDLHLGFTKATVYQQRNVHDLMSDFADEVDCYLNVKSIVRMIDEMEFSGDPLLDLEAVYLALANRSYVKKSEVESVLAWIQDYRKLEGGSAQEK